jgi:pSer/pThr/pTyr-binding forkhead associated (FHA) protein
MPAQLLSLSEGPSVLLDKPIVLVGRHEECDLQLNSRKVSRKHCCIAQVKDYLAVRDLGSTNGIRINGTRVLEGILRTGDVLTIGDFRYQVHADLPREVAAAAPPARPAILVSDRGVDSVDVPVAVDERSGAHIPAEYAPHAPAEDVSEAEPEGVHRASESSSLRPPA